MLLFSGYLYNHLFLFEIATINNIARFLLETVKVPYQTKIKENYVSLLRGKNAKTTAKRPSKSRVDWNHRVTDLTE